MVVILIIAVLCLIYTIYWVTHTKDDRDFLAALFSLIGNLVFLGLLLFLMSHAQ